MQGAHNLKLNYESKCQNLHGYNWIVVVYCKSKELDENGMIIDFKYIKNMVSDKLDHQYLNEIVDFNPTAENMAKCISIATGSNMVYVQIIMNHGCVSARGPKSEGATDVTYISDMLKLNPEARNEIETKISNLRRN